MHLDRHLVRIVSGAALTEEHESAAFQNQKSGSDRPASRCLAWEYHA